MSVPEEASIGLQPDRAKVPGRLLLNRQVQNDVCETMPARAGRGHELDRSRFLLQVHRRRKVLARVSKAVRRDEATRRSFCRPPRLIRVRPKP